MELAYHKVERIEEIDVLGLSWVGFPLIVFLSCPVNYWGSGVGLSRLSLGWDDMLAAGRAAHSPSVTAGGLTMAIVWVLWHGKSSLGVL